MHYPIHTAVKGLNKRCFATSSGAATRTEYAANALNQYTAEGSFAPAFDADGNQTLVKTSTGIWRVSYNAKNRPVRFVKDDETLTVECTYDSMGRRATKKVTLNGAVTEHRRFLYRGVNDDAKNQLYRHESNRAYVYKEIYDKLLTPVSNIRIVNRQSNINLGAYINDITKLLTNSISSYANHELGVNSTGRINDDNISAAWQDKETKISKSTTNALSHSDNNIEKLREDYAFAGFLGAMYTPNSSKIISLPSIKDYITV